MEDYDQKLSTYSDSRKPVTHSEWEKARGKISAEEIKVGVASLAAESTDSRRGLQLDPRTRMPTQYSLRLEFQGNCQLILTSVGSRHHTVNMKKSGQAIRTRRQGQARDRSKDQHHNSTLKRPKRMVLWKTKFVKI